jgi:hypothetical protein
MPGEVCRLDENLRHFSRWGQTFRFFQRAAVATPTKTGHMQMESLLLHEAPCRSTSSSGARWHAAPTLLSHGVACRHPVAYC